MFVCWIDNSSRRFFVGVAFNFFQNHMPSESVVVCFILLYYIGDYQKFAILHLVIGNKLFCYYLEIQTEIVI